MQRLARRDPAARAARAVRPPVLGGLPLAAGVIGWVTAVLLLDRGASLAQQRWLGVGTWVLLAAVLATEPARTRIQVLVVVAFATAVEYTFSGWLHTYVYRLHDVPWFVPPGHGLVYLGALAIGRSPVVVRRARLLVPVTVAAVSSYALWGLFLSGRRDELGAFWAVCLVAFLLRGRQPTVFVGAFVVVTYLELLGTHLGTWTWGVRDPIAHVVAMGNPPSGAAGGYGFFDAAALVVTGWLDRRREHREQLVVQEPVAADRAAEVRSGAAV